MIQKLKRILIYLEKGNDLTFPWNMPLDTIGLFVSFALTISGFLIATASFLMGLYIREFDELAQKDELLPYVYVIVSLIISSCLVIVLGSIIVISSAQPLWVILILMVFLSAPLLPVIAIIYILIPRLPGRSSTG